MTVLLFFRLVVHEANNAAWEIGSVKTHFIAIFHFSCVGNLEKQFIVGILIYKRGPTLAHRKTTERTRLCLLAVGHSGDDLEWCDGWCEFIAVQLWWPTLRWGSAGRGLSCMFPHLGISPLQGDEDKEKGEKYLKDKINLKSNKHFY